MVVDQRDHAFHAIPLGRIAARRRQLIGHGLRLLVQYRRMLGVASVYSQTEIRQINFCGIVLWIQPHRAADRLVCVIKLPLSQEREP